MSGAKIIEGLRQAVEYELRQTISELRKRIAELEAFVKCPIGLDEASDICSAGTCRVCLTGLRETLTAERQRRESAEAALLMLDTNSGLTNEEATNAANLHCSRYLDAEKP